MAGKRGGSALDRKRRADAPATSTTFANPERGEHELTLDGQTYRLRPSFTAIVAIERETEKSLMTLVRLANTGALDLAALGTIAAHFIRAGAAPGDDLTRNVGAETISKLIFETGVPAVTARLTLALADALTAGCDAEGNAKAATA